MANASKENSDLMNQYMSGYQQRWRNVYTNGSFLQGEVGVEPRQMAIYFNCQVSPRLPAPSRVDGTVHMQFGVVAEEVPPFSTYR